MMMRTDYVPNDLLVPMLLKLPVRDLLRFQSVCKCWHSLITSPSFIARHREANNTNVDDLYLLAKFCDPSKNLNVSLLSHRTLEVLETHRLLFGDGVHRDLDLVSCCNGVVCLRDLRNAVIILWNPARRETRLVPSSSYHCRGGDGDNANRTCSPNCRIGFGFDAKSNDYKVVAVHVVKESELVNRDGVANYKIAIEVYSLETDSWRLVSDPRNVDFVFCSSSLAVDAYVDGMHSWLVQRNHHLTFQKIVTFDMSEEKLVSTALPRDIEHGANCLTIVDGSLAIINVPFSGEYEVWVLGQCGVRKSWKKLCKFGSDLLDSEYPLGYWRNNKLLMKAYGKLELMDLVTKRRVVGHPSFGGWNMLQVIGLSRESLVPVRRKGEGDYESIRFHVA